MSKVVSLKSGGKAISALTIVDSSPTPQSVTYQNVIDWAYDEHDLWFKLANGKTVIWPKASLWHFTVE